MGLIFVWVQTLCMEQTSKIIILDYKFMNSHGIPQENSYQIMNSWSLMAMGSNTMQGTDLRKIILLNYLFLKSDGIPICIDSNKLFVFSETEIHLGIENENK